MKIDLSGKVILLTGASRGIGRAIAGELLGAGATVALHYRQREETLKELAGQNRSKLFPADLVSDQQAADLFHAVLKDYGRIDILINNAGIALNSPVDSPWDRWMADWQKTLSVNLTAPALLCKLAISAWKKAKQPGRIINIASRAAFRGDTRDYLAYASSKGGLVSLTRSIAREFGKDHITAYTVAPGFIRTDMAQDFFDRYGEEKCLGDLALPEIPTPMDVARPVVFLCSDSAYQASGCTLDINSATYFH